MNLGQFLEKFGRTMFERPLATSPDPDEPPVGKPPAGRSTKKSE